MPMSARAEVEAFGDLQREVTEREEMTTLWRSSSENRFRHAIANPFVPLTQSSTASGTLRSA